MVTMGRLLWDYHYGKVTMGLSLWECQYDHYGTVTSCSCLLVPVGLCSSGAVLQWGCAPVGLCSSGAVFQWGCAPVGLCSSVAVLHWDGMGSSMGLTVLGTGMM